MEANKNRHMGRLKGFTLLMALVLLLGVLPLTRPSAASVEQEFGGSIEGRFVEPDDDGAAAQEPEAEDPEEDEADAADREEAESRADPEADDDAEAGGDQEERDGADDPEDSQVPQDPEESQAEEDPEDDAQQDNGDDPADDDDPDAYEDQEDGEASKKASAAPVRQRAAMQAQQTQRASKDLSGSVELDSLTVSLGGATIYAYEEGEAPTVSQVELERDSQLEFNLTWKVRAESADDTDFKAGDSFRFTIMDCDFFADMSPQEVPLSTENLKATGIFEFKNGRVTYTVTIDSISPNYTPTSGKANGWAKLSVEEGVTEITITFRDEDNSKYPVKQSHFGGGIGVEPKTGEVVFIKSDSADGDTSGTISDSKLESLTGIPNVSFAVYQVDGGGQDTGPLSFWQTGEGYLLASEEPADYNGKAEQVTTDRDGRLKLIFSGDYLDKQYYLKELSELENYYPGQNQRVVFQPSSSKGLCYAVYNVPRAVRLKKVDADTGRVLAGVEFALYDGSDALVESFRWVERGGYYLYDADAGKRSLVTDKDGMLEVRGLPVEADKSAYYFTEVAPLDDYLPNGEKYEFTVSKELEDADTTLIVAENTRVPFVEVAKQGVNGSNSYALSDVRFTLFCDALGYRSTKTTGQNGLLIFDDFPEKPAGTYTLREEVPNGYKGVGDITIVIGSDGRIVGSPSWSQADDALISWNAPERRLTVRNTLLTGSGGEGGGGNPPPDESSTPPDESSTPDESSNPDESSTPGESSTPDESSTPGRTTTSGGGGGGGSSSNRRNTNTNTPVFRIIEEEAPPLASAPPEAPSAPPEDVPYTGEGNLLPAMLLLAAVAGTAAVCLRAKTKQ